MQEKLWNVLIHMAADNNLKEECIYELTEILDLGKLTEVEVAAQFDSGSTVTQYDFRVAEHVAPSASLPEADLIAPPELPPESAPRELDDLARVVIAGRETLQQIPDSQIISSFLKEYASRERLNFIVLSGHGSGAVGEFLPSDNPPNALSIPALKSKVIEPLANQLRDGTIDVLGLDSCLMSMVETCYQLQPLVRILIGAEGFEQNAGWPYHKILRRLRAEPRLAPDKLARLVVGEYVKSYAPYYASGISIDLTACDLSEEKTSSLAGAIRNLATQLRENLSLPQIESAILLAHWRAQSYKFEQYTDLWDFCHLLKSSLESGIFNTAEFKSPSLLFEEWESFAQNPARWAPFRAAATNWEGLRRKIEDGCRDVMSAIEDIVIASGYHGAAFQHSHGLSIYFPWSKSELARNIAAYSDLVFSAVTGWDQFLIDYVNGTQREVRDDHGLRKRAVEPLGMSPRGRVSVQLPSVDDHRTVPSIDTRTVPSIDTRTVPSIDTRTVPSIDTRGKMLLSPDVKNPPTEFYRVKEEE